ncbi:unnamed protein product [Urochloa humidicola]
MPTSAGGAAATAHTPGRWPRLHCPWLRRPLMGLDEARRVLLSAGRCHPESSAPRVRGGRAPPSRPRRRRRSSAPQQDALSRAARAGEGRGAGPHRRADLPTRSCGLPRRSRPRPATELALPPS